MDLAECERNINDVKIINTTVLKNKLCCHTLYYNTGV